MHLVLSLSFSRLEVHPCVGRLQVRLAKLIKRLAGYHKSHLPVDLSFK